MKLALYQIEKEYIKLSEMLIESGGELTDEMSEALQINEKNLETKATNYGFVVKEIESEIEIIDAEIKRLTALKSSRVKSVDRLKETLSKAMQLFEIDEIKSPVMKINFRNSESVEVENIELLDVHFVSIKETKIANKDAIKKAIKEGVNVRGAVLKQNKNLQIK